MLAIEPGRYNFKKDVVDGGGYDEKFMQIIQANKELKEYFQRHAPPILNAENYKIIAYVSKGTDISILLAEERGGGKGDVLINILHKDCDDDSINLAITEYMFHEKAHQLLDGQCKTTKPIGFIRQKSRPDKPYNYMMVFQHCPVSPGPYSVFTLMEALSLHATKPLMKLMEWRNICLSLIKAVETLQHNDIYHNAIMPATILLEVSQARIDPLLIDFYNVSRGRTGNTKPLYASPENRNLPFAVPELYVLPNPLPTSDLYSVTCVIMKIVQYLKFPLVEREIAHFHQQKPRERELHFSLYNKLKEAFTIELKDRKDLTVEDRAPPLEGKFQISTSLKLM